MIRFPLILSCDGSPDSPHETVTWQGDWLPGDADSAEPACFVCGAESVHPVVPLLAGA